jgi:hypothetical protein
VGLCASKPIRDFGGARFISGWSVVRGKPRNLYLDPNLIALAMIAVFAVVFYFDSVLPKRRD